MVAFIGQFGRHKRYGIFGVTVALVAFIGYLRRDSCTGWSMVPFIGSLGDTGCLRWHS